MAAKVPQLIIEEAWLSEALPDELTDGIIVKMPKKGNLKICVLSAISKIISKVILHRINDHLYSTIVREQSGFRHGSSCVDHINTLRLIIEQSAEYRFDLQLVFADFEKAFDSVDREILWMALSRRAIPNKFRH